MTIKSVKLEIGAAIQLLTENVDLLDPKMQRQDYNLSKALIHISRALERIADELHSIERQSSRR